jgi:ABC-type nickel/cobalt efflux system permease component RcnA
VNNINKISRVGFLLQCIGLLTIMLLILLNKPVPDVIMWIFSIGLVITLISVVFTKKNKNGNINN